MKKRETMSHTLEAQDFKYEQDARAHCDPQNDFESVDVEIDATIDPCGGDVEDLSVTTHLGADVTDMLTDKAYAALADAFFYWEAERERERWESAREARDEARLEEWKDSRAERRKEEV